jgi:hypothetical protein
VITAPDSLTLKVITREKSGKKKIKAFFFFNHTGGDHSRIHSGGDIKDRRMLLRYQRPG